MYDVTEMYRVFEPDEESVISAEDNPRHEHHLGCYDVFILLLGIFIVTINFVVVVSSGLILKKGQEPLATYLLLGNVALSDLITGISVIIGKLLPRNLRNHQICAIRMGMIVSSSLASVYSLGLIALDRYLFIIHGLKYQQWVSPFRVRLLIGFTWIIGCALGFLPLMGWYGDTENGRICWFTLLAPKELILATVTVGAVPLLLVTVLYTIILQIAIKKISQMNQRQQQLGDNTLRIFRGGSHSTTLARRKKWKAVKVVVFSTIGFTITWGPYFICSLLYGYCKEYNSEECTFLRFLIASPLAILGFSNSLMNPIIYAWWHKGFRSFVFHSFRKYLRTQKYKRESIQTVESHGVCRTKINHALSGSSFNKY